MYTPSRVVCYWIICGLRNFFERGILDILVVDNSPLFQQIIGQLFADTGLKPNFVDHCTAALELVKTADFAFVCGAYHMPDMTGIELCRQLRKLPQARYIPYILFTADEPEKLLPEAYAAGVTDVIEKKSLDYLVMFMRRLLVQHEPLAGHVLIVEDSADQSAYYGYLLKSTGLKVDIVDTAEKALEALSGRNYDLVMLDVVLAGPMSGVTLANQIRRMDGPRGEIKILAITAFDDPLRRIELFHLGVDEYVAKPVIGEELQARVRNMITHHRLQQQARANFDPLTGLPNRRMFRDRLGQELKKAHRSGLPLALMVVDLDRFKDVNETLGYDLGDIVIKEIAQRLRYCMRETDTLARMGGDEFGVILSELIDFSTVERVANCILRGLAEPFCLSNETIYLSASLGITIYPDDATDRDTLIKNAEQAKSAAQNEGRNRFNYFTPFMQEAAQIRLRLRNDLRGALSAGQFLVHYQPIVEMATGLIRKAEALVRWKHPKHGLVSPATFIPIAEETGAIIELGDWVFGEVARQVLAWRASLHPEFQISVNKSPIQFRDDDALCSGWLAQLQALGLPGHSLVVEITEGLLMEASKVTGDKLSGFRVGGMKISLDDFGTGYSSLSYLKKFDIDYIKIDQSFVSHLAPGASDLALCEAIIVMAHKLGIKVIAEGIETEQQRDLLARAGCDYGQGYLWSRPVPPEEFEKLR